MQQTNGSSVTNYLWDEASTYGDVVLETAGTGVTQASYVLGDGQVLAQTRGGTTSYYLYDGQGSVRGLTNSAGTVTDAYAYDAFGNALSSQGSTINPFALFDFPLTLLSSNLNSMLLPFLWRRMLLARCRASDHSLPMPGRWSDSLLVRLSGLVRMPGACQAQERAHH